MFQRGYARRVLITLTVLIAGLAGMAVRATSPTASAGNQVRSASVDVGYVYDRPTPSTTAPTTVLVASVRAFDPATWQSGPKTTAPVRSSAAEDGGAPFAMGIEDHLDQFAASHGAETWKDLPDPVNWKSGVLGKLSDPSQRVLFNLEGVDALGGVARASAGGGGATDSELLRSPRTTSRIWSFGMAVSLRRIRSDDRLVP